MRLIQTPSAKPSPSPLISQHKKAPQCSFGFCELCPSRRLHFRFWDQVDQEHIPACSRQMFSPCHPSWKRTPLCSCPSANPANPASGLNPPNNYFSFWIMFLPPKTFRTNYISLMLFELLVLHLFQESLEKAGILQRKRQSSKEGQYQHFTHIPCPQPKGKYEKQKYPIIGSKNSAKHLHSRAKIKVFNRAFYIFLHPSVFASFPTTSIFYSLPSVLLFHLLLISLLVFPIIPSSAFK